MFVQLIMRRVAGFVVMVVRNMIMTSRLSFWVIYICEIWFFPIDDCVSDIGMVRMIRTSIYGTFFFTSRMEFI